MKYLFVCKYNYVRSVLAEKEAPKIFKKMNLTPNISSARIKKKGLELTLIKWGYDLLKKRNSWTPDHFSRELTKELCNISDRIFVMNEKIAKKIIKRFNVSYDKIENLNIANIYSPSGNYSYWLVLKEMFFHQKTYRKIRNNPEIILKKKFKEILENRLKEIYKF